MSNHLSQDQFAKYMVGRPTKAEMQHISECPECSAELDRFSNTLSLFRSAVRQRIDDRVVLNPSIETPFRPAEAGLSNWRWAAVAAAVVAVVVVPFFMSEITPREAPREASSQTDPDVIMNAVNLHLLRVVPAPLAPLMPLTPSEEFITNPGGIQ